MWSMEAPELSSMGPRFPSTVPLNFTKFSCLFAHSYSFNSIFHANGSKTQLVLQEKCLKASRACLTADIRADFLTPPNDPKPPWTIPEWGYRAPKPLVWRAGITSQLQKQKPSCAKLLPTRPKLRRDFFYASVKASAHDEDAREQRGEEPGQVRPVPTLLFGTARGTRASWPDLLKHPKGRNQLLPPSCSAAENIPLLIHPRSSCEGTAESMHDGKRRENSPRNLRSMPEILSPARDTTIKKSKNLFFV